ncbi:MAG: histidine kinase [Saprospiraceae bacterium]|nr:histidine kinase [Saprospiraceae bacterium]
MKKWIYIIVAFFCSILYCKSQEPYHINYTSEDGLPSNEVYCVYQDTSGFMWFGTDNGVSRFDGYSFENFGLEHGLGKLEINQIIRDNNENVWFSSYYGKVYSFKENEFFPYAWNHILDYYSTKTDFVNLQHIDNKGSYYFKIKYIGILVIHSDGCEELFAPDCAVCEFILRTKSGFLLTESVHYSQQKNVSNLVNNVLKSGQRNFIYYDLEVGFGEKFVLKNEFQSSNNNQIFRINDSIGLFNLFKRTYTFYKGKLEPLFITQSIANVFYSEGNDLYIGYQNRDGLHVFRNWRHQHDFSKPEKWLNNTEVSNMIRDKSNGFWVTSVNRGIFYYPNDHIKVFKSDLTATDQRYAAVLPYEKQSVKAISHTGGFMDILQFRKVKELKIENLNNSPDIALNDEFTFSRGIKIKTNYDFLRYGYRFPSRFEKKSKSAEFYGADRYFLFKYNPETKEFDLEFDNKLHSDFIYDLKRDDENILWLATSKGLKKYNGLTLQNTVPSLQGIKTVSLDQLSTGEWVVGTKGKGIYIINVKKDSIINISTKHGLTTNVTDYVWVDDFDNIWAASLKGLNKISIQKNADYKIRHYHKQNGLPSEEILMVRTQDSLVWVGTANGVACFYDTDDAYLTFKPEITRMYVNGKPASDLQNLNSDDDNIRFELRNFDFNFGNKVRYRYKLNTNKSWTAQSSNLLNFISLSPGKYMLEIQAENKDNIWSESLMIPFTIHKPWWLTWPFLLFVVIMIVVLTSVYYRSRLFVIRTEQVLKNQMLTYEKQALLAQMNPHFIFNAFSAIQFYINTKATKKADDYLTDFSYLIRKILDNSNKKDILLSEEIKLIRLYTELEEKRFDHKFETIFFVDDEIDADATRLPCMLVQPLVENAINHGLMHLTQRRGKLQISFRDLNGSLRIEVEDNGVGMEKSKDTSLHKMFDSYGLKLLKDRITSYHNSGEYFITLSHEDLFDDNVPGGTRFILDIVKGQN